jgi:hypothetical protein
LAKGRLALPADIPGKGVPHNPAFDSCAR